MDKRFQHYGETVCQFVSHATSGEKAAIRAELTAHMEDHAQALLDSGYDQDHALTMAVESMGDPKEVGKALNKEYPLLWLILSRGLLVVILLLAILLTSWSWQGLSALRERQEAKAPSLDAMQAAVGPVKLYPLDLTHPITEDVTLSLYGVGLWQQEDGSYSAYVCAESYPNSIWDTCGSFAWQLEFLSGQRTLDASPDAGGFHSGVNHALHYISGLQYGDPLTARYDRHGMTFDLDIPLPWKEVSS